MTLGRRWLAAGAAAAVLALAAGAQARIPLDLRFDGQALDSQASPDFTCFNYTPSRWLGCRVRKADAPGAYVLERPEPRKYRMHVSIDENPANPRRYPGDYEAQVQFEVTDTGPARLTVDLPRLIHLTRPGHNGRALEGMLTGCATQPTSETPRYSWGPTARVEFAWESVVASAEYRVSLVAASCGRSGAERAIRSEKTGATAVALELPPSAEGEYYRFRIEAWKNGRLIGDLDTHDGGAHSWNYRFRVLDASVPRWAYLAAGAGLVLLALLAYRALAGEAERRRSRARRLVGGTVALLVGAAAGGAYHYDQDRERQRAETENARLEAERQARQREFVAAFASAAPRPGWWDEVETPYRVAPLGGP